MSQLGGMFSPPWPIRPPLSPSAVNILHRNANVLGDTASNEGQIFVGSHHLLPAQQTNTWLLHHGFTVTIEYFPSKAMATMRHPSLCTNVGNAIRLEGAALLATAGPTLPATLFTPMTTTSSSIKGQSFWSSRLQPLQQVAKVNAPLHRLHRRLTDPWSLMLPWLMKPLPFLHIIGGSLVTNMPPNLVPCWLPHLPGLTFPTVPSCYCTGRLPGQTLMLPHPTNSGWQHWPPHPPLHLWQIHHLALQHLACCLDFWTLQHCLPFTHVFGVISTPTMRQEKEEYHVVKNLRHDRDGLISWQEYHQHKPAF